MHVWCENGKEIDFDIDQVNTVFRIHFKQAQCVTGGTTYFLVPQKTCDECYKESNNAVIINIIIQIIIIIIIIVRIYDNVGPTFKNRVYYIYFS